VITTVDAVNGLSRPESIKQVAVADRLVLTKTDLAPDVEPLVAEIRRLNPDAPLWRAAEQEIDVASLFDDMVHSPLRAFPAAPDSPHGAVHAFALTFEGALDWTMFGIWLTMLLNRHGAEVLRVKGILNVAGSPTPVAVHGVQHLVHPPVHMAAWPDDDRRSRLVFIVDGLSRQSIERSLSAFLNVDARVAMPAVA
jgi:G3E family GTPase